MRTLVNLMKRMGAPLLALLIVVVMLGGASAETTKPGVTFTKGGYYGSLTKVIRTPAIDGEAKASTVTPIGAASTTEPTETVPGRFSIYNIGTGSFSCLVRVVTVTGGVRAWQDFRVMTDPGDPSHFSVNTWATRATIQLWEDVNSNGVIDAGDKMRRRSTIRTSKGWARRHFWLARQKDLVVNGSGTVVTPPPATGYPKGAVVSRNQRSGFTMNRIDYGVGTTVLAFNYPNVPFDSWAYEMFPSWYGVTLSEKVTFNDAKTSTKAVTAPASATADATVTVFDTVDN
jgi:hypothetical protein